MGEACVETGGALMNAASPCQSSVPALSRLPPDPAVVRPVSASSSAVAYRKFAYRFGRNFCRKPAYVIVGVVRRHRRIVIVET